MKKKLIIQLTYENVTILSGNIWISALAQVLHSNTKVCGLKLRHD
jgi:hypothetical protein